MTEQSPVAEPVTASEFQLATTGYRILANIIDGFIFVIPAIVTFFTSGEEALTGGDSTSEFVVTTLLLTLAYFAYEIVGISKWGRTIGKALLGIEVVSDLQTKQHPPFMQSARRFAVKNLEPVVSVLSVAAILTNVFDPTQVIMLAWAIFVLVTIDRNANRQGVHDRAARTYVLKK